MMDGLYTWIRSVACYFLFMSVLDQLLPSRKYVKYIRLFGGMILILLVFHPLIGGLHIEERIARYYEDFVFQDQASDLKQEILGVEKQQLSKMIRQYENAIAQDIRMMAEDTGVAVQSCVVEICRETEQEQFGQVQKIALKVSGKQAGKTETQNGAGINLELEETAKRVPVTAIEAVEKVVVGKQEPGNVQSGEIQEPEPGNVQPDGIRQPAQEAAGSSIIRQSLLEETSRLRRKIASYYDLEETYVEIQIVEREG